MSAAAGRGERKEEEEWEESRDQWMGVDTPASDLEHHLHLDLMRVGREEGGGGDAVGGEGRARGDLARLDKRERRSGDKRERRWAGVVRDELVRSAHLPRTRESETHHTRCLSDMRYPLSRDPGKRSASPVF